MLYEVVESRKVSGDVISDEIVRLTAVNTSGKYPQTFRRVRAIVEVNGERREMTFLTNNVKWAAGTICELYKARWEIEVFFKELKQTLQLTDFIGTNENAVKWQIWTGLLTHLLLHYLKFLSGWDKAFSRLVGIVRSAVWMDLDIVETLRLPAPLWDGITPSTATPALHSAAFGGLLSARPRILWDSIPADGGVPPQLWNKTARKTRAKANEIRASAGQLRSYGMVVFAFCNFSRGVFPSADSVQTPCFIGRKKYLTFF